VLQEISGAIACRSTSAWAARQQACAQDQQAQRQHAAGDGRM